MIVSLTLEENNRTILQDAYYKIIQDIVGTIKIPYSSIVILHKDTEATLTDNKINVSGVSQNNIPSTVSKRRIITSITEDYNENELTSTLVHQDSSYPIFQDQDIDVYISPVYVKSDINIEFSYISPSKTEATRIRDDIRIRLSQTRNISMHDINYNILIPDAVEEFIADVHLLKSRLVPQSLETYFREHSTNRVHLLTDMANKENAKIAVNETQVRIVGVFNFNSMPEKLETDNENGNYKLSFTYKLSIDVPRAIVLKYPVMICNKPLPAKYLQYVEDNKIYSKEESKRNLGYTSYWLQSLSHFEAHRQLENRIDIRLPINVPLFDDFKIREGHKGYAILASFLTDVNESDKRSLFNLRDISPYYIPDSLLNYISAGENSYLINPYMSFLYFGLYQGDRHFDNNILAIDENLNIKSTVDLSLFKPVRVTLSFILDITMLDTGALYRLLNNEEILLIFLNEYVRVCGNFKTELYRNTTPATNIYKTFIYILQYFISRDSVITVTNILKSLEPDNVIYNNLTSILYNNYSTLYRYLNRQKLIDINKTNKNQNKDYTRVERNNIKTVMNNYVAAAKKL